MEKQALNLPANIRVAPIPAGKTLAQMLADGEIDALHTARMPSTFHTRPNDVRRLFSNYADVEKNDYRQTHVFPIMHTVAIRREVYEKNRWIAQSLTKAFINAQRKTYADLSESAALKTMLPWLTAHVESTRVEMGDDFWAYGLEKNYKTLQTFLGYHAAQGLSARLLTPEALFAPESLESFKI